MKLVVNGEERDLPDGQSVSDVVKMLGIDPPRGIAVAVDGEVVRRSEWEDTRVTDGQKIEVVRAVQGG